MWTNGWTWNTTDYDLMINDNLMVNSSVSLDCGDSSSVTITGDWININTGGAIICPSGTLHLADTSCTQDVYIDGTWSLNSMVG